MANKKWKMMEQMQAGEYASALETLAELVEMEQVDAECLYEGAYAYFMLGDYERAAGFVNNTLSYAPDHVKARILLARICIVEDRTAEALAVLDVLLSQERKIPSEETEEIRDIVEYYGRTEAERLRRDYPHIAAFLGIGSGNTAITAQTDEDGVQKTLLKLRNLVAKTATEEAHPEEGTDDIAGKIMEIERQTVPMAVKVQLLNRFAGGYFVAGNEAAAEKMLTAALRMDTGNDAALRGMALLAKQKGETERALKFAANMKETDFVLLQMLRS